MDNRTFFDKVSKMRYYQKQYFKYRRKSDLTLSKQFEAQIDEEIKRVNAILGISDTPVQLQASLFNDK